MVAALAHSLVHKLLVRLDLFSFFSFWFVSLLGDVDVDVPIRNCTAGKSLGPPPPSTTTRFTIQTVTLAFLASTPEQVPGDFLQFDTRPALSCVFSFFILFFL